MARADFKKKTGAALNAGLIALDRILSHVSPMDALKIVFTPENMKALGEGLAKGAVEGAKS